MNDVTPADEISTAAPTPVSRRTLVKGVTALATGAAASMYVKPGLRQLGIAGVLAQVSPATACVGEGEACDAFTQCCPPAVCVNGRCFTDIPT